MVTCVKNVCVASLRKKDHRHKKLTTAQDVSANSTKSVKKIAPNVQNDRGEGERVNGFLNSVKKTAEMIPYGIPKFALLCVIGSDVSQCG